jgi:hypothetical protein
MLVRAGAFYTRYDADGADFDFDSVGLFASVSVPLFSAANQEKVLQAGRALEAAAGAAPVDQAATDRLQKAADAISRAYDAEVAAQADLDAAGGGPAAEGQKAGADVPKPGADVQKSDVEKAPTFEPDGDGKPVDDVM